MRLVDQWREIERQLPAGWSDARFVLRVREPTMAELTAALLAPLLAGRSGDEIRFHSAHGGAGPSPDAVRRLLRRLDREGIRGELELASVSEPEPGAMPIERPRIAEAWDAALEPLPPDWSDVYAEIELTSTDLLERAALSLAPVNPARHGDTPAFRFRVARRFGYGASPGMVRRCLERMDEDGIKAQLRILYVLSDTDPVATQGPVWYLEGKAV
jgi:hypothetical protein